MKLRDKLLEILPRNLALRLYLIRNNSEFVQGTFYKDYGRGMFLPRREKLWKKRLSTEDGHEKGICKWMEEYLNDNDIYIDVGSAFGFFPGLISSLNPNIEIHAFEAGWRQFHFLKMNSRFYGDKWYINNKYVGNASEADNLVSLDEYCRYTGITPTLIQIDVDGFETKVIQGSKELLQNRQTEFLIEVHPVELPKFGSSIQEFMALIPEDYIISILTDLREGNTTWSKYLEGLNSDPNPYLYITPPSKNRMKLIT